MNITIRRLIILLLCLQPSTFAAGATSAASGDDSFARLEREYVLYFLARYPVVATYLGGSALDATLADVDASLRDYSSEAITSEDERLKDFRQRFAALDATTLSARRRIDRDVALAQI